jgi:carboxymethylenebutenolidase
MPKAAQINRHPKTLGKSAPAHYPLPERTFAVRTGGCMGEWLHGGSPDHRAYLALPDDGAGPGVLVLHAWWGLTPVFTGICDRLAAAGFVALAPGLFPGGATAATIAAAEVLRDAHDEAASEVEALVLAAVNRLRGLPQVRGERIGVVGFSLGASWAMHLSQARPEEIGAAVVYYGSGSGDYRAARAAYLGHFAELDDFEPLPEVRALQTRIRAAGREATFHVYPDTRHWFAEPDRPEYDAAAAKLAWERTIVFLHDRLG